MGTRNPSLYTSCFHWMSHQHRGPGRLHSTSRSPFPILFSMAQVSTPHSHLFLYACRLQFSRLSPALQSALLWIMPGFGRFEHESSTSWHTTPLRLISCRSFDAYANTHITIPRCLVAPGQANRSKADSAVLVEKLHAYARSSKERWTSAEGSWTCG